MDDQEARITMEQTETKPTDKPEWTPPQLNILAMGATKTGPGSGPDGGTTGTSAS
ncbi:MAG: hypothetical protein KKD44_16390 [Proteobacteria bacterium]|nr:hypothetical protein [Pseudomonadota bacterium]